MKSTTVIVLLGLIIAAHCESLLRTDDEGKDKKKDREKKKEKKNSALKDLEQEVGDLRSLVEKNVVRVLLGSGSEPETDDCYRVCAGDSGRGTTVWIQHKAGKVSTTVDISGCGFTAPPIITTAVTGNGNQDLFVGSSAPFGLKKDSFVINMLGFAMTQYHRGGCGGPGTISAEQAMEKNWHVKYVAVGHTCPIPEL